MTLQDLIEAADGDLEAEVMIVTKEEDHCEVTDAWSEQEMGARKGWRTVLFISYEEQDE